MLTLPIRLRPAVAGSLILIPLVAVSACSDTGENPERTSNPVGHVHGLGVDPRDRWLYAATHFGVYRIRTDEATLVGPPQDTMGFTVVGPDEFLASGHPATSEQVNPLGLIKSTDQARTWRPVAFAGEADFHAIDVVAPWTYAYRSDQGELLRSKDRVRWETVTESALLDIAIDPGDPSRVLTTSTTGQLASIADTDPPTPLTSAPPMGAIDYAEQDLVVGLGSKGEVHVSRDDARTWRQTADLPGESQALVAEPEYWYAATSAGIFRSHDDGVSWKLVYETEHG